MTERDIKARLAEVRDVLAGRADMARANAVAEALVAIKALEAQIKAKDDALIGVQKHASARIEALEAERSEAEAKFARFDKDREIWLKRGVKLEAERDRLREIEWIRVRAEDGTFYETCPACWADRAARGGHTAWCWLSAALAPPGAPVEEGETR